MASNGWRLIIGFGLMAHFSYTRGVSFEDIHYNGNFEVDYDECNNFEFYSNDNDYIEQVDYDRSSSNNISFTSNKPSLWTSCTRKCARGLQKMKKWEIISATNGGSRGFNLPHPIRTCNEKPCGKIAYSNLEIRHGN